jgi:uncharacterized protein YlxW (UPF0749 family)
MSMAMLDQLLTDTLDPGYKAASQRAAKSRWYDGPLVWIGCAAVGLLLVMAYDQSHRSAPARAQARQELVNRIHTLGKTRQQLEDLAKQLSSDVAALRDAQLTGQQDEIRGLEVAAGSSAVSGPGIVVKLSEPPKPTATPAPGSGPIGASTAAVLHDTDIRSVVNALWASGAEAIAVNGIRLTATSAIRFAGESVLVDFQPINSPYEIDAIGPRNALQVGFADSPIASALKTKQDVQGIGFDFSGKAKIQLPSANVTKPRFAVRGPAPTAKASASPSKSVTNGVPASPSTSPTESPR